MMMIGLCFRSNKTKPKISFGLNRIVYGWEKKKLKFFLHPSLSYEPTLFRSSYRSIRFWFNRKDFPNSNSSRLSKAIKSIPLSLDNFILFDNEYWIHIEYDILDHRNSSIAKFKNSINCKREKLGQKQKIIDYWLKYANRDWI